MDYAAPYKGNFICSIEALKKQINLKGGRLIYLFPIKAKMLDWVKELQDEEENIYFIDNSFFSKKILFRNLNILYKIVKKERVSIIHTHFIAYNFTLFVLKKLLLWRIKIIGHFHSQFLYPRNIYTSIKVFINNVTFDLIIGVSDSVAAGLCKAGINPDKVTYFQNAIDFNRLDTFKKIQLKNADTKNVILMFGWPFYIKGVDIALEAIKQLNIENNDILLAISLAGDYEMFEREIGNHYSLRPPWIKILKPCDDIATYYNAADIFLSASREEGFSYALVEAAYCNPLLISSDIPAPVSLKIPDLYTYRADSVSELKEVISIAINLSKEQIAEIKTGQREFVKNKYGLFKWTECVNAIYDTYN